MSTILSKALDPKYRELKFVLNDHETTVKKQLENETI